MTLRARCLLVAASLLAVTVLPSAAAAQRDVLLDFEEFASPVTPEFGIESPITSRGFVLTTRDFLSLAKIPTGRDLDFSTWGNDPELDPLGFENHTGSTALFANIGNSRIDLTSQTPAVGFNLRSMDVAPLYATTTLGSPTFTPFNIRFFGFSVGSTTSFFQDFLITTPGSGEPTYTTLVFDSRWSNLDRVFWFQANFTPPGNITSSDQFVHQFDNVALQVVPEPSTVLLLGGGLAILAVGGLRQRRRAAAA